MRRLRPRALDGLDQHDRKVDEVVGQPNLGNGGLVREQLDDLLDHASLALEVVVQAGLSETDLLRECPKRRAGVASLGDEFNRGQEDLAVTLGESSCRILHARGLWFL